MNDQNNPKSLEGKRYLRWLRCSTRGQADTSIEDQINFIDAFAAKEGMIWVDDVVLDGVSGLSPKVMAMADPNRTPPKLNPPKKTKQRKRKKTVRPSIRRGAPTTPISYEEERKFLRQTSLRRTTKTFQKWIERMSPDETQDSPPF